ncbi:MAG: hypothetical protein HY043_15270, partial [Verrucomicrobia bacterium]|nr:hypothetical protein [Verrucomicrobiota bacterium]
IIGGIVAVLVGLAFVFPAVAKFRLQGNLPVADAGLLLLGLAITLGGAGAMFAAVRSRKA